MSPFWRSALASAVQGGVGELMLKGQQMGGLSPEEEKMAIQLGLTPSEMMDRMTKQARLGRLGGQVSGGDAIGAQLKGWGTPLKEDVAGQAARYNLAGLGRKNDQDQKFAENMAAWEAQQKAQQGGGVGGGGMAPPGPMPGLGGGPMPDITQPPQLDPGMMGLLNSLGRGGPPPGPPMPMGPPTAGMGGGPGGPQGGPQGAPGSIEEMRRRRLMGNYGGGSTMMSGSPTGAGAPSVGGASPTRAPSDLLQGMFAQNPHAIGAIANSPELFTKMIEDQMQQRYGAGKRSATPAEFAANMASDDPELRALGLRQSEEYQKLMYGLARGNEMPADVAGRIKLSEKGAESHNTWVDTSLEQAQGSANTFRTMASAVEGMGDRVVPNWAQSMVFGLNAVGLLPAGVSAEVSTAEAAQSAIDATLNELRKTGPADATFSKTDLEFIRRWMPQLSSNPEARRQLVERFQLIAERTRTYAALASTMPATQDSKFYRLNLTDLSEIKSVDALRLIANTTGLEPESFNQAYNTMRSIAADTREGRAFKVDSKGGRTPTAAPAPAAGAVAPPAGTTPTPPVEPPPAELPPNEALFNQARDWAKDVFKPKEEPKPTPPLVPQKTSSNVVFPSELGGAPTAEQIANFRTRKSGKLATEEGELVPTSFRTRKSGKLSAEELKLARLYARQRNLDPRLLESLRQYGLPPMTAI